MNPAAAICDFAAAPHALPAAVRADAERLLADTLAVGAAGAASPEALLLLDAISAWEGGGKARLLCGGTASASAAAFFNGFAIHCLEWDGVHEPAVVHALSVVTAALLAVSDRMRGSDAERFLTSLAVGVDVASGLGLSATGPMKFFRPATAGVLGATLAIARFQGLDRADMVDALGLAYSFASGTMQAHVEASVALPLQIANAARSAVTALHLTMAGLTGPHAVLEGPFGYSALIEPLDLARYTPGDPWRISEVSIKPYPSGRASHGALGALADLRGEGLTLEQVSAIELFAPPLVHRLVGRPFQRGAASSYNRLCLGFLAPLMLRDGQIDPQLETTVEALAAKTCVTLDGNADGNALSPQRLVVTLTDGTTIERVIPANLGSPEAPLSPAQSAAKYDLCRALAGDCDPRIFTDPLAYATEPA